MTPDLFWTLPFVALLTCIATLPLFIPHWWEKNYPFVSVGLALIPIVYYCLVKNDPHAMIHAGLEYISFIALIGALFVVAGGIHIRVKGEATPLANCVFLAIGAVLSNFLGTTGASMVLIRPWIRMNKYRITSFHIVFFIFIVSNTGGCLTPIGDPPLFLGYLRGIPFTWTLVNLWMEWLLVVCVLLAAFFILDRRNFMRAPQEIRLKETSHEEWALEGKVNIVFLFILLASVFINKPHFLREGIMVLVSLLSLWLTPKHAHEKNHFSLAPIREVAILFLGIFATMVPALQYLEHHAADLGIRTPGQFFWFTGFLSSVLDNAPTYLNFLTAAQALLIPSGLHHSGAIHTLLSQHGEYVKAISLGAVFFGAMTYIGNGPNFLVKSIADQSKIKMPSFFGYVLRFSVPVLLPLFFLVWLLFFRVG